MLNATHSSLTKLALDNKEKYSQANPFPHIVFDNFLDENEANILLDEFPNLSIASNKGYFNESTAIKLSSPRGDSLQSTNSKKIFSYFNSSEFIDFLQELTGISESLIPDPHFVGGGYHQIHSGGYLKIHADYCRHPETRLDRRVNILLYLNKNWKESYGGALELWDTHMSKSVKQIYPIFNRLVIFNTNDFTYHGHPDKLNCPKNITRKSIALYYFSNGRPSSELRDTSLTESTLFMARPEETFVETPRSRAITITKKLLPPIIIDSLRVIMKKIL